MSLHLLELLPELKAPVHEAWRAHFADDFQRLKAIPSTPILTLCSAFLSDRTKYGVDCLLRFADGTLPADEVREAWKVAQAVERAHIWLRGYSMAKMELRIWLKNARSDEERAHVQSQLDGLAGIDSPKATEVRRVLKPLLAAEFGTKLTSDGGGMWMAPIAGGPVPLKLMLDFGGFEGGMRWDLQVQGADSPRFEALVSYEEALGFRSKGWNLLRSDVLEGHLRNLMASVREVVGWLGKVDWDSARARHAAAVDELRRGQAREC